MNLDIETIQLVPANLIPPGEECPLDSLISLWKLGLLMQDLCEKAKGIGLSAVQVGIPINFFVVRYGDDKVSPVSYRYFANCRYESLSKEKTKGVEGCLSLLTKGGELRYFEVERYNEVKITGKELLIEPSLQVKTIELTPVDYYKIVFQHEIDHASGVLISDIGREVYIYGIDSRGDYAFKP